MTESYLNIERYLTVDNIENEIKEYIRLTDEIPKTITAPSAIKLLTKMKRQEIGCGPYPSMTIFESANRIMSDLTILYGVRALLHDEIIRPKFNSFKVQLGTEKKEQFDVIAENKEHRLIGEAFNVAKSFFQTKKSMAIKKIKIHSKSNDIKVLMYNSDAVSENYTPSESLGILHIRIHIPEL